jgi:hypothetical protein
VKITEAYSTTPLWVELRPTPLIQKSGANTAGRRTMARKFEGYVPDHELPIKQGDTVTIPKGTLVRNVNKGTNISRRTYKIRVDHFISGYTHEGVNIPPMVCWAGAGGYWSECDINDIPEAIQDPPCSES